MREVIERLVEEHVAESSAEHNAEDAVEQQVIDIRRTPSRKTVPPRTIATEHDEQYEAGKVHEPVPANGERSELDGDGVELRMYEHVRGYIIEGLLFAA